MGIDGQLIGGGDFEVVWVTRATAFKILDLWIGGGQGGICHKINCLAINQSIFALQQPLGGTWRRGWYLVSTDKELRGGGQLDKITSS